MICFPKEDSSIRGMELLRKKKRVIKRCKKSQQDSKRSSKVKMLHLLDLT